MEAQQQYPIAANTEQLYRKTIASLVAREFPNLDSPQQWPTYYSDLAMKIARLEIGYNTKNTYRAALLWDMRNQPMDEDIAGAMDLLHKPFPKPDHYSKEQKQAKKAKKKTITVEELELLRQELEETKGEWAYRVKFWIMAGLACGLRPNEWLNAEIIMQEDDRLGIMPDGTPVFAKIQCHNSKIKLAEPAYTRNTTKQFAPVQLPPSRVVPLTEEGATSAMIHLTLLQGFCRDEDGAMDEDKFEFYYHNCRRTLYRAVQNIWKGKKQFSLYTMRGQFHANMRALFGADAHEMMGHSRPDTASRTFYGRASSAHSKYKGYRLPEGMPQALRESLERRVAAMAQAAQSDGGQQEQATRRAAR